MLHVAEAKLGLVFLDFIFNVQREREREREREMLQSHTFDFRVFKTLTRYHS